MSAVRGISIVAALLLLAAAPVRAQDPHHPAPAAPAAPQMPAGPSASGGMAQAAGMGGAMPMMAAGGMMGPKGMMDPAGMMGGGMMGRIMPMMGMADHIDGWLAFLQTELKITEAQAAVWNAFADAMRGNAGKIREQHAATMQQDSTLPARLAAQEQVMTTRLATLQRIRQAVEPLYAALDDAQKKMADELLGPHGMM